MSLTTKTTYTCQMSKKRYNEIMEHVLRISEDEEKTHLIMEGIKSIMHYDPDFKTYDKSMAEKMKKYRQEKEKKFKEMERLCKDNKISLSD